jgi:hypothetical protein
LENHGISHRSLINGPKRATVLGRISETVVFQISHKENYCSGTEFWKPWLSGGLSVAVVGPATAAADMDLELQAVVTFCNFTEDSNSSQSLAVSSLT